jgi:hypothetical protein
LTGVTVLSTSDPSACVLAVAFPGAEMEWAGADAGSVDGCVSLGGELTAATTSIAWPVADNVGEERVGATAAAISCLIAACNGRRRRKRRHGSGGGRGISMEGKRRCQYVGKGTNKESKEARTSNRWSTSRSTVPKDMAEGGGE